MDDPPAGNAEIESAASNRRGFPRVSLTEAVKIQVQDQLGAEARYGTTTNVSRGGLIAHVEGFVEEKTRCIVRFLSNARVKPTLVWGTVMAAHRESGRHVVRIEFDTPLEELRLATARRRPPATSAEILIADDEAGVRDMLRRFLMQEGYKVQLAHDGAEALARINEHLPDVLLLDLYMPGLNGLELLSRLRESSLLPRVVFTISGEHDDASARESLTLGAQDFIVKPIDLSYLDWAIRLRL